MQQFLVACLPCCNHVFVSYQNIKLIEIWAGRSDARGNVVDVQLTLACKHAEEVADEERLLDYLFALAGLEDFDRRLIAEFSLHHVVQRVKVHTVVALLHATNILHARQVIYLFVVQADYASAVKLEQASVLINDDALNLAAVQEDQPQDQHDDCHHVLPPVP